MYRGRFKRTLNGCGNTSNTNIPIKLNKLWARWCGYVARLPLSILFVEVFLWAQRIRGEFEGRKVVRGENVLIDRSKGGGTKTTTTKEKGQLTCKVCMNSVRFCFHWCNTRRRRRRRCNTPLWSSFVLSDQIYINKDHFRATYLDKSYHWLSWFEPALLLWLRLAYIWPSLAAWSPIKIYNPLQPLWWIG